MKKFVAFLFLAIMAGCVTNGRTFNHMSTSVRPVAVSGVGQFEATHETYIVSDLDEVYHLTYFPSDNETYYAALESTPVFRAETIFGTKVHFVYPDATDDEPIAMAALVDGQIYEIGTDAPVKRKDVMIDLFKYYFDLR